MNDRWRLNEHWSFNVGLRYDQNDGTDAEGKSVVAKDDELSPRLGASWGSDGREVDLQRQLRPLRRRARQRSRRRLQLGRIAGLRHLGLRTAPAFNTPGQPLVSSRDVNTALYI